MRPPRRLSFPRARQAICVRRSRRARGGKTQTETVYAVTDLDFDQATPTQLAEIIRGHPAIENRLHSGPRRHVRRGPVPDPYWHIRAGSVMATFRNIAISLHRLAGATTIAQATRAAMRRPERILPLIT